MRSDSRANPEPKEVQSSNPFESSNHLAWGYHMISFPHTFPSTNAELVESFVSNLTTAAARSKSKAGTGDEKYEYSAMDSAVYLSSCVKPYRSYLSILKEGGGIAFCWVQV